MKFSTAGEAELLTRILMMRDRPLDFAASMIPWGKPGTAFANIPSLAPWQVDELQALQDHLLKHREAKEADLHLLGQLYKAAWSSGRGLYKSALLAILTLWHLSTHIGGQAVVAANSENQLRARIFPEFALWFGGAVNAHWWNVEGLKITPAEWLVNAVRLSPEEGGLGLDPQFWGAFGQMWSSENPSGFAGGRSKYGTLVVFDEASGIPEGVWTVTEGFFAPAMDYKLWFAASQMRSNEGAFHAAFYNPDLGYHAEKNPTGWRTRTMSAEIMPVQAEWARQFIAVHGRDSDKVRTEVLGLPPQTRADQFIPREAVLAAMGNVFVQDYGEPLIFGVDPAPRGRTAIRARQGRNARDCLGKDTAIVVHAYDNVQLAEYILFLDHKYKPAAWCIDAGLGTGVIDILKRRHLHGRMIVVRGGDMPPKHDGQEFGAMTAYLWGKLRDWLPMGMIPRDDFAMGKGTEPGPLGNQLTDRGWKWSGREDGKKILEQKADMANRGVNSPDDADALSLTFAVNPPRSDRARTSRGPVIVDGVSANPFNL